MAARVGRMDTGEMEIEALASQEAYKTHSSCTGIAQRDCQGYVRHPPLGKVTVKRWLATDPYVMAPYNFRITIRSQEALFGQAGLGVCTTPTPGKSRLRARGSN